jgi:hypothetical protein
VLRDAHEARDVVVSEFLHDISANPVAGSQLDTTAMCSRSLLGSTACGLCGPVTGSAASTWNGGGGRA